MFDVGEVLCEEIDELESNKVEVARGGELGETKFVVLCCVGAVLVVLERV